MYLGKVATKKTRNHKPEIKSIQTDENDDAVIEYNKTLSAGYSILRKMFYELTKEEDHHKIPRELEGNLEIHEIFRELAKYDSSRKKHLEEINKKQRT